MRYSNLLGKTIKQAPADETSVNAQLLIRGGFIQKEMAGVYAFLPLGNLVQQKIIQVIREEMNEIGGQEILLGALQNPEVWQKTNRWDDKEVDVWFKTKLANGTEIGLGTTHEEPLTKIMIQHIRSYKDLPMYAYQFQTKFRNELRSKSGLLRTREFIMKDLYSFNTDLASLEEFYEKTKDAYFKVFARLGIGDKTYLTFASGGSFSKYSHEFQTICENGEDTVYLDVDKKLAINKEVYTDELIEELGLNKEGLQEVKVIEVGNIFKLGTKYSEPLGLTYTAEDGSNKPVVMGSYGLGPARSMATVVELLHDEKGIVWPEDIAPFKAHLIKLNENADAVYEKLIKDGIEVLFDDRVNTSAGEKFADADLIGCPYRLVVSDKTGEKIELKRRTEEDTSLLDYEALLKILQ